MARRLTTSNLVAEVRSLIDENDQNSVDTLLDILPSLNRAQDTAADILSRAYQSPLLAYTTQALHNGQQEYPIPRDAFEQKLEKIEVQIQNGLFNPLKRQSYRDATLLETTAHTSIPMFYSEIGDVYRLYPSPTGAYPLRVWYLRDPPPLVLEQGTIVQAPNLAGNYINVDAVGSQLTTNSASTASYVNFVDGTTGNIKGTCQLHSVSNNRLTFKTVPTRALVLDRIVAGSLPTDLAADDLICTVDGTCVPLLKKPFSNYLIQMAASELLNTKLGMQSELAEKMRGEMERYVKESWAGREVYLRIRSANPHWERIGRRYGNRY